jgi:putative transposase
LCRATKVSRSGYYAWTNQPPSPRCVEDVYLTNTIREIHRRSRRTYGAPRIHGQLFRLGTRVGRKRVARLMAQEDLVGVHARKKWRRGRLGVAPAGDLLKRDFSASRPNERWVADITEFSTGEGKLFLAGVRDLCGRGLVGWSMGNRQTSELVIQAVTMAVARREPGTELITTATRGASTRRSTSPTIFVSSAWSPPMDRRVTAMTTPPWRRSGPRSSESSAGCTDP